MHSDIHHHHSQHHHGHEPPRHIPPVPLGLYLALVLFVAPLVRRFVRVFFAYYVLVLIVFFAMFLSWKAKGKKKLDLFVVFPPIEVFWQHHSNNQQEWVF
jgi:hypothetical protein